ncbi:MAG: tetratricopeptide repeat protein [bacterium]|nr:tetratricopeptide repeat protein [bacterium]
MSNLPQPDVVKPARFRPLPSWLLAVLLLVLASLAYADSLSNPFLYDDIPLILQNPEIRSLDNLIPAIGLKESGFFLRARWTRKALQAAQWALAGPAPELYHATNIILHACVAILLFALIARLSGDRWLGWWSGALFAVHPILTDVVTPASGVRGLLAALFALLAVLLMDHARRSGGFRWIALAAISLYLSIASKEVGIIAVAGFILVDLYRRGLSEQSGQGRANLPTALRRIMGEQPLRYLGAIALVLIASAALVSQSTFSVYLQESGGSPSYYDANGEELGFTDRARLVGTGARLLLVPIGQSVDYFYDAMQIAAPGWTPLEVLDLGTLIALLVLTAIGLWRLNWIGFGGIWFLLFLAPTMGFIRWHEVFAERFLYLPAAGICVALAGLGVQLARKPGWGRPMLAFGVGVLVLLGSATVLRNRIWSSELSLWQDAVDRYPRSVRAHKGVANAYRESGDFELALMHYEKARTILPIYRPAYIGLADTYLSMGRVVDAQNALSSALQKWPEYSEAWFQKGVIHERLGKTDRAIEAYEQAIEFRPDFAAAYNNLGRLHATRGDLEGALELFLESLEHDPSHLPAIRNLAVVYRRAFQDGERAEHYEALARRLTGESEEQSG